MFSDSLNNGPCFVTWAGRGEVLGTPRRRAARNASRASLRPLLACVAANQSTTFGEYRLRERRADRGFGHSQCGSPDAVQI
jgi:hypothetical protein